MSAPAVAVDPALSAALAAAVAARGLPVVTLPSGAGHDGVALGALTAVAMLFVRCAGGLSHHPDESVEPRPTWPSRSTCWTRSPSAG